MQIALNGPSILMTEVYSVQDSKYDPLAELSVWEKQGVGEDRDVAAARIRQAYTNGCIELDLSSLKISTLPDMIGMLTHLQKLHLSATQLTSLPTTIGQLSDLQWLGASFTPLAILPDTIGKLTKLGYLDLSGTQLTILPNTIGSLDKLWLLNVSNTPMDSLPDTLDKLSSLSILNIKDTEIDIRLLEQVKDWYTYAGIIDPSLSDGLYARFWQWQRFSKEPRANCLHTLLQGLQRIYHEGITSGSSRRMLAERVVHVLEEASQYANLRTEVFNLAEDGTSDCEDRIFLTFNDMEAMTKVYELERTVEKESMETEILYLARGMFRQRLVDEAAIKVMQQQVKEGRRSSHAEALEVQLALRCVLGWELDLPFPIEGMLYEGISGLTKQDIEYARVWVEQEDQDIERAVDGILMQPVWVSYLTKRYAKEIQLVKQPFEHAMSELEKLTDKEMSESNSNDYLLKANALLVESKKAVNEFMKVGTLQAMSLFL